MPLDWITLYICIYTPVTTQPEPITTHNLSLSLSLSLNYQNKVEMSSSRSLSSSRVSTMFLVLLMSCVMAASAAGGNFSQDVDVNWGGSEHAKIFNGGQLMTLSLDKTSGSGFQSKNDYLFAKIYMQLKLVPGNSAGTVTTYYASSLFSCPPPPSLFIVSDQISIFNNFAIHHLVIIIILYIALTISFTALQLSSQGPTHDEIDFEFLGNVSGQPYTVHTNVYAQGKGNREQQFHLWFDPTTLFHTYSIVWNPQRIIFLVDNIPIRVFDNNEAIGVPFPNSQPMKIYSSLWNADDWATQGGRVKANWTEAPFTASYKNFNVNGCVHSSGSSSCGSDFAKSTNSLSNEAWQTQQLDSTGRKRLRWVQQKYMIYNYCTDFKRFSQGLPRECKRSRFL